METPLFTLERLIQLFSVRKIDVENIQLYMQGMDGMLIVHCLLERDRLKNTVHYIEKIKGVIELKVLEAKSIV